MKIGLKLDQQLVINTTHIVDVCTFDKLFHIGMVNGLTYIVIRQSDFEDWRRDDEHSSHLVVEVNEYHRIQRELSEYLGVEITDCESEPESDVA